MQFSIRDLLIATTLVAVHLSMLHWQLGDWVESLPSDPSGYFAFLPTVVVLAFVGYKRLTAASIGELLGDELLRYESPRLGWKAAWLVLAASHLVVTTAAVRGDDPAKIALYAHQAIGFAIALAYSKGAIIVHRDGIRSSDRFVAWSDAGSSVGWEDGGWCLRAAARQTDTSAFVVRIPEADVPRLCELLAKNYAARTASAGDAFR
ncbi:MAG: hypothetical protein AAF266_14065 [Planctomycetota bacterium]